MSKTTESMAFKRLTAVMKIGKDTGTQDCSVIIGGTNSWQDDRNK